MPKRLSVDPHAMNQAATTVTGSGDDFSTSHTAARSRISSASLGWAGRSADALTTRVARWDSRIKVLVARIEDHANNIRISAAEFAHAEDRHREMLRNVAMGLPDSE
jgi:WXG100 family type VII secretion target